MIDPDLERAYRATSYWVDEDAGRFTIRCDEPCPALDRLLADAGATNWAFLTAWNPRSTLLTPEENLARQWRLEDAVGRGGWTWHRGAGVADRGGWPAEPSLLVLGITLAEAKALGRAFGQHAILAGARGGPARLVWLTPGSADGTGAGHSSDTDRA